MSLLVIGSVLISCFQRMISTCYWLHKGFGNLKKNKQKWTHYIPLLEEKGHEKRTKSGRDSMLQATNLDLIQTKNGTQSPQIWSRAPTNKQKNWRKEGNTYSTSSIAQALTGRSRAKAISFVPPQRSLAFWQRKNREIDEEMDWFGHGVLSAAASHSISLLRPKKQDSKKKEQTNKKAHPSTCPAHKRQARWRSD